MKHKISVIAFFCILVIFILWILSNLGGCCAAPRPTTICIPGVGYDCMNPSMNTSGLLSFVMGQASGQEEYNIQLACAATSKSTGYPYTGNYTGSVFYPMSELNKGNTSSLSSGQVTLLSGLPCFSANASASSPFYNHAAIGDVFIGSIWYNFTTNSMAPNAITNPWLTVKMAAVSVKVT